MIKPKINISIKLLAFTCCAFFVVALCCGYYYLVACSAAAQKNIGILEVKIQKAKGQLQRYDQLLKDYQDDIARFNTVLFKEKDVADFLTNASAFSKEYHIKIKTMRALPPEVVSVPQKETQGNNLYSWNKQGASKEQISLIASPYNIQILGASQDIFSFMLDLGRSKQLLTLSDIRISGSRYPDIEAGFRLDLYRLNGFSTPQERK